MPSASNRVPSARDLERIKQIAVDADMFGTDEVGFFDDMLGGFLDGSLAEHRWLVADDDRGQVVAAADYAGPQPAIRDAAETSFGDARSGALG